MLRCLCVRNRIVHQVSQKYCDDIRTQYFEFFDIFDAKISDNVLWSMWRFEK